VRVDLRAAEVHTPIVGVLDADWAEDGLDVAIDPDTHSGRRDVDGVTDPGLRVIGEHIPHPGSGTPRTVAWEHDARA